MNSTPSPEQGRSSDLGESSVTRPPLPPLKSGKQLAGMDLLNHVAHCLRIGCDHGAIRARLMGWGMSQAKADTFIKDAAAWMDKNPYAGQVDRSREADPRSQGTDPDTIKNSTPKGDLPAKDDAISDEAYTFALEQLVKGVEPANVRKSLIAEGLDSRQVDQVISYANKYRQENEAAAEAASHRGYFVMGLILWAIGIVARVGFGVGGTALALPIFVTDTIGLVLIVMGFVNWRRNVNSVKK